MDSTIQLKTELVGQLARILNTYVQVDKDKKVEIQTELRKKLGPMQLNVMKELLQFK